MAELSGTTLGRYRIMERVGRGGMAEVYKGYQTSLDRYVAVKVLHAFLLEEPDSSERFRHEAKAVASLRHPNIVQVFDFDEERGIYFMVMEYIDGPNLKSVLQAQNKTGTILELPRIAEIMSGVGGALAYAHQHGMIHRDIKPHNIMFTAAGQPLLTDFGIAKIVSGSTASASGVLSGTPAYMSPEQGRGDRLDHRTDLYSLGVVLYEMVTGRVPFDADTPFAVVIKHINDPLPLPHLLNTAVPEPLERVILRAMAKSPDERFQSADELVRATQQAITASAGLVTAWPVSASGQATTTLAEPSSSATQPTAAVPTQLVSSAAPVSGQATPAAGVPLPPLPPTSAAPAGPPPAADAAFGPLGPTGPTGPTAPNTGAQVTARIGGRRVSCSIAVGAAALLLAVGVGGGMLASNSGSSAAPVAQVAVPTSPQVAILATVESDAGRIIPPAPGSDNPPLATPPPSAPTELAEAPQFSEATPPPRPRATAPAPPTADTPPAPTTAAAVGPTAAEPVGGGVQPTRPPVGPDEGGSLLDAGQPAAALAFYDKALKAKPGDVRALVGRGQALHALLRPEEATDAFTAALQARPDELAALLGRGRTALERGRPDEALADAKRLVALDPNSFEGWLIVAEASAATGDSAASTAAYATADDLDGDDAALARSQARVLIAQSQPAAAIELLKDAADTAEDAATWTALGQAYLAYGSDGKTVDPDAAEAAFRAAIDKAPATVPALLGLADIYINHLSNLAGALNFLNTAIKAGPVPATAYQQRARLVTGADQLADLSRAVAVNPRNPEPLTWRGDYQLAHRQYQAALDDYDAAIKLDSDRIAFHAARSRLLLLLNKPDDAVSEGLTITLADPKSFEGYFALARVFAAQGYLDEALASSDTAVEQAGADYEKPDAYAGRGRIRVQRQEYEAAERDFAEAAKLYPDNRLLLLGQAELALAREDPDAALPFLNRWTEQESNFGWGYVLRAKVYLAQNKSDLARADLAQAATLALFPSEETELKKLQDGLK